MPVYALVASMCMFALVAIAPVPERALPTDYKRHGYELRALAEEELPYNSSEPLDLDDPARPVDAAGVQVYERDGERHFHPVGMAQYGLAALNGHRVTGNPEYLRRAEANAQGLLDHAERARGGVYFPYTFDFELFGDEDDTIRAPWWSAMAQGQALSLFTRLHATTGEQRWMDAAQLTFTTFLRPRSAHRPWIMHVDRSRYLWLEEYAGNTAPLLVFNGHVFAIWGLYDYWRASGDDRAVPLMDGAITTIRAYADDFRVPGDVSFYSLRVREPYAQSEKYHRIHARQLAQLATLTDELWFQRMSERFHADFS